MKAGSPKAREGDLVRLLVDVDGYLSKRIIPRGTDGVVVEAYTEPSEGYAVDVTTSGAWSPGGLEFDNIILRREQFELVPHPCTMYIDADVSSATDVADQLAELINGRVTNNDTTSNGECSFAVCQDPPAPLDAGLEPDFTDFRFRVTGEAHPGVSVERMASVVGSILEHYWADDTGAVALCDYRRLLPRNGGLPEDGD